jgi:uncharacterized RmlC-like cupin family protein
MDDASWRNDGVRVVRANSLYPSRHHPGAAGRATAVDFSGSGRQRTWIGTVTMPPGASTGPHHHSRHEVSVYVIDGRSGIRWSAALEFAAEVGPGDFIYFSQYEPHQERILSSTEPLSFLVVRSDSERIAVALDLEPVEQSEMMFRPARCRARLRTPCRPSA